MDHNMNTTQQQQQHALSMMAPHVGIGGIGGIGGGSAIGGGVQSQHQQALSDMAMGLNGGHQQQLQQQGGVIDGCVSGIGGVLANNTTQQQQISMQGGGGGGGEIRCATSNSSQTPQVEIKLFVGRVPRTCTEEQLKPIFDEYARVNEIVIIRDKTNGSHKGSAFVRLASITEADYAIRSLNNIKVLDPNLGPLQVRYAQGEAEKLGLTGEGASPGQDQTKLFVGSLPKGYSEEEVHKLFSVFGSIDEVYLLTEGEPPICRGCAFVKFTYKEQAMNAIKTYNGQLHLANAPRPLEVRVAEKKTTQNTNIQQQPMSLTGVNTMTNAALMGGYHQMNQFGGGGAMSGGMRGIQNAPPSNSNPRSAGAWKEYFTADNTPYYHNEHTNITQWEKPIEFDQLPPPGTTALGRSDVTGPPGANIFVFHIPNEWSTNDLHSNFSPFGTILSAHIPTDKHTNRNKGYAFVSFDNIQAAVNAVNCMNGHMAGSKRLKVSIKQHEDKYVAHLLTPNSGNGGGIGGGGGGGQTGMMTVGQQNMRQLVAGNGSVIPGQSQPTGQHVGTFGPAGLMPHFQTPGPGGYGSYQYNMAAPTAQARYPPY